MESEIEARVPILEAEKKLAIQARNFKEAGRVTSILKELGETRDSATKELEDVEDGAFVRNDQPCTRYTWKFRVSEDQTSLTLLDSNYPVNLTSARWEQGSSIEMKYLDLVLPKA